MDGVLEDSPRPQGRPENKKNRGLSLCLEDVYGLGLDLEDHWPWPWCHGLYPSASLNFEVSEFVVLFYCFEGRWLNSTSLFDLLCILRPCIYGHWPWPSHWPRRPLALALPLYVLSSSPSLPNAAIVRCRWYWILDIATASDSRC